MADLVQNRKAYIVDVRTPGEYKRGHVKGSINIPLNSIGTADKKLKGKDPIVLCCASGARSGQAARVLKTKGFEAYNGLASCGNAQNKDESGQSSEQSQ
ncbi:unnamed protein product, partial [Cyprideis torosa]